MKTATLTAKVNVWLREHLAMKTPAKLLGGLALGALVMTATALTLWTTYADEPARPLSSGQSQCYPEDVVLGWCYGFADAPHPALTTGTSVSGVQFEEWPEAGFDSYTYHRFMVEQGKLGSRLSSGQFEEWPEVGLDSYIYHRFMVEQGKVGRVLSSAADSLSSIDLNEVWTEIEDTPVYHLMKQLKAGSPLASEQGACYPLYPELGPCPSEFIAVAPAIVDRYDRGLFDEVLLQDLK